MIIVEWKYINKPMMSIEEDKIFCNLLQRVVDLGWSERVNLVSTWVSALNSAAGQLYVKHQKTVNKIQLTKNTFDTLQVIRSHGYDNQFINDGTTLFQKKLGHYKIEILEDIGEDIINVCSDDIIEGQIHIIK